MLNVQSAVLIVITIIIPNIWCLQIINKNLTLNLNLSSNEIKLLLDNQEKLSGLIGEGRVLKLTSNCEGSNNCVLDGEDGATLTITSSDNGFDIEWRTINTRKILYDCFDLKIGAINWFGGSERLTAQWPIETLTIPIQAYRSSRVENGAIAERYWLNSKGAYIFIHDQVPLFLDQNSMKNNSICYIAKNADPFRPIDVILKYTLVAKPDAKQAHLHAVEHFLGKPLGRPNEKMIRYPIWSTWAKYKKNISDAVVVKFAKDITEQGFTGQLEIDDFWETCYGSLVFNENFADINNTVKALKDLGFTVTLWTHPFVNDNCKDYTKIGRDNNYFIKSKNGSDFTTWWNSDAAHHINFQDSNAQDWFVKRLKLLKEKHGIDSFKFDAGESDWPPQVPDLNSNREFSPNSLTSAYVKCCATFGDFVEVRAGWRTQHLPIFVRMLDKESRWGLNNGLHNLITTLLQMNIAGYTLILPDMIGGNGYNNDVVTPELLVRWIQANIFMPAMQFSYLPWEITSDRFDVLEITKDAVALHELYTDDILAAMNASITKGTPVNPPIWWLDPTNPNALKVNDEYLLGETILVAPVIKEGAISRDIVLPKGYWKDGNNGTIYQGPSTMINYPAPIHVLPYFIKQ